MPPNAISFEDYLHQEKKRQHSEFIAGNLLAMEEPNDQSFSVRMNLAFLLNEHLSKSDFQLNVCTVYCRNFIP